MDPDNFHDVNGTAGDVKNAEAWGSVEGVAIAKTQQELMLRCKLREAVRLLETHGYTVTAPHSE